MEKARTNAKDSWSDVIFESLWKIFIVTTITEAVIGLVSKPTEIMDLVHYYLVFLVKPMIFQLLLLGAMKLLLLRHCEGRIGNDIMSLICIAINSLFAWTLIVTHPEMEEVAFTLIIPILVTVVYRKKIYIYLQVAVTVLLYIVDRLVIIDRTTAVWRSRTAITDVIVFISLVMGFALVEEQVRRATLKLDMQSSIDSLTKLYNHETFYENLDRYMEEFRENKKTFSLIIADIDNFKQVNDTYGHSYGDDVIRTVTASLMKNCSVEDLIARYGGEEFAVLLPGKRKSDAILQADKIRRDFERQRFESKDGPKSFTISLGVAEYNRNYDTSSAFFEQADEALYEAKRNGKNKVCCK